MAETTGQALQVEALARRFHACFNERRFDEAERMVDAEALFTYPGAPSPLIGRAGCAELVHRWANAFPDGRVALEAVHVQGEVVVAELIAEGTHEGTLDLPGLSPVPATGRRARLRIREILTFRHGLLVSVRLECDPAQLRRTLRGKSAVGMKKSRCPASSLRRPAAFP